MRLAVSLLAALLVLGANAPPPATVTSAPKVAVIVGPVGDATDRYLARGEAAARAAEKVTPNVVRVFTPNATWPAVKKALQGASIVVYLGHGNGWPSPYRNALYPPTQNGFGLNPVAGGDNSAHQYFGEGRISREVRLARGAVVLLHHLCYASGNSEPGLPEGSIDDARQRVDNYAAGFIAAGASAVVAEGGMGPAWYVEQLLSTKRGVEQIWAAAPTANGHTSTFDSRRSPGFVASVDPDRPDNGFYRSLVVRSGLRTSDIGRAQTVVADEPAEPTLAGSGLELGVPYFKGRPVAGSSVEVWFPYTSDAGLDPTAALTVSARWDSLGSETGPPGDPPPPPSPVEDGDEAGEAAEAAAPLVPSPADPPRRRGPIGRVSLVQPEQPGSVVEPVSIAAGPTRLRMPVEVPAEPGRYRLVLTLHDASGVAYDLAAQALVPALLVRVTHEVEAAWLAPASSSVTAGEPFELPVAVANVGSIAWGGTGEGRRLGRTSSPATPVAVGHWIPLAVDPEGEGKAAETPDLRARLPAGFEAGATEQISFTGPAPASAGQYLLVLDVIVPGYGSLAAAGAEPVFVRIVVE